MTDRVRKNGTPRSRSLAERPAVHLYRVANGYPWPYAERRHHVFVVAASMGEARRRASVAFAAAARGRAVGDDYSDPEEFDVALLASDVGRGGCSEVWT